MIVKSRTYQIIDKNKMACVVNFPEIVKKNQHHEVAKPSSYFLNQQKRKENKLNKKKPVI